MTVPATTRKAGPYTGTGVQTVFPFSFKVFAITDVKVVVADTGGNESTLSSDYTVTVNADQVASPGGSVTLSAALASGYKLTLLGNLPYDQTLALPGGGNFNPVAVENALDRIVEQVQQISEAGSRVLALPATANASGTLPAPAANKVIGWNATGDALQNLDPSVLATIVAYGTANSDIFTGTGAQTTFVLSNSPGALNNLDVSVGGVTQLPGVDYTWTTGTTVTFTAAPGADELWVASNPHPTHEGYDGTTRDQHCAAGYAGPTPFDQCATGTTYTFTFNQIGTWGYHNHGNHSDTGTVIVQ